MLVGVEKSMPAGDMDAYLSAMVKNELRCIDAQGYGPFTIAEGKIPYLKIGETDFECGCSGRVLKLSGYELELALHQLTSSGCVSHEQLPIFV